MASSNLRNFGPCLCEFGEIQLFSRNLTDIVDANESAEKHVSLLSRRNKSQENKTREKYGRYHRLANCDVVQIGQMLFLSTLNTFCEDFLVDFGLVCVCYVRSLFGDSRINLVEISLDTLHFFRKKLFLRKQIKKTLFLPVSSSLCTLLFTWPSRQMHVRSLFRSSLQIFNVDHGHRFLNCFQPYLDLT